MDDLACIVENDVVQEGIRRGLEGAGKGVEIRYQAKVKGYTLPTPGKGEEDLSWAQVHMENGETLKTRLLVRIIYHMALHNVEKNIYIHIYECICIQIDKFGLY